MSTVHVESSHQRILRINQRKDKYKRSTNNSHKKFICIARKLLYKYCREGERELFQREFYAHQNSRVYYFIILSHAKMRMNECQRQNYRKNLTTLLTAKIQTYNQQILNTNNKNFINFRIQEIADIQFAINALNLYFQNRVPQAIEAIYKKEKGFVLKKQQYQMAIEIVMDLQSRLKSYPQGDLLSYLTQKRNGGEMMEQTSNRGRAREKQDEEWVWEKQYRQSYKKSMRKQRKLQNKVQSISYNSDTPLLFLQNSYQYNPHFFSILFNYQPNLFNNSYLPYPQAFNINKPSQISDPKPSQIYQGEHSGLSFQQNIQQNNNVEMNKDVKREQIEEINYLGSVKCEYKEKEFLLLPPQTTKELDVSLN